ncbi:electron transport complex subunit RsxD [Microbulbifer hydrolyticus]|uniref:Ion-translocating oxidoreductase complex subunit D n=1 Tax=Microbulbifer hydrolyticus TaxID=48074 RepID=A0A6P1TCB3_9GAMM|nr:electron transport complex subunit RsxD [Microbulbifer hydrolyticus]MBB5212878.1 electron transport complex protein RnfD [Microbulbifer hydrolyticus]QHQ38332.1 electron transport complex subunit RsxD [Microbulbifer hydrolyticus]
MSLMRVTSPHAHSGQSTSKVMLQVVAATVPGVLALVIFFGPGVLINIALCAFTALATEAAVMKLRDRPVGFYLKDYSALVTALLLGIALPPYCPWWIPVIGSVSAILLAKQLYGGMGYNPFNPAMVGYVVLLISFPVEMTRWVAPAELIYGTPGLDESFALIFGNMNVDGFTRATPLEIVRHNQSTILAQLYEMEPIFNKGTVAGVGWEMANFGFLLGGLFLLFRRLITWHAPVAMLVTMALLSVVFYDGGSSLSEGSPLLHLFSGATMLGAFFIVTDPVSGCTSNKGRLVFGAGVGLLVFVIRAWGAYPDGVAFAVLLMNFAAPFIDNYTLPRTYGHKAARKATDLEEQ